MLNVYGVTGSDAMPRDSTGVFFSSNFKPCSSSMEPEFARGREFPGSDPQQQGSGLLRYRSAPSTVFAGLFDDDFLGHLPPPRNEPEPMFSGFVPCDGSGDSISPKDARFLAPPPPPTKQEVEESGFPTAAASTVMDYGAPMSPATGVASSYPMTVESSHCPMRSNGGNLVRQSSSPPEFFSGFDVRNYGSQMSFSTGQGKSRFMPGIAENGNESWNEAAAFGESKRKRDGDFKVGGGGDDHGLAHHLSLPKTSAEMAAAEKFLRFQQDSIPCKIRAKRGCATHPRSIAERNRRTRISERMRKLQELFPSIDKQANTSDMLDMAIQYIKDLQKLVQKLEDTKAKCKCSSSHHHYQRS